MTIIRILIATFTILSCTMPAYAEDTTANSEQTQPVAQTNLVNINTASVRDLIKVKGINATKARAIVAYRKKHGNFKSVDTLAKVKGFNKMRAADFQALEEQLTT
jgi:competence ComEA-like helix-hairpin-helix protein